MLSSALPGHPAPPGLVKSIDPPKQALPLTLFIRDRTDAMFPKISPASRTVSAPSLRLSRPAFPFQGPKALLQVSDPTPLPDPPGPPPPPSRGRSCWTPLVWWLRDFRSRPDGPSAAPRAGGRSGLASVHALSPACPCGAVPSRS